MSLPIQWPSPLDAHKPLNQWTDADYLRRAYRYAVKKSDDPMTQNGAILVPAGDKSNLVVFGANQFPPGVEKTQARRRDKHRYTEHAERNTIYIAALRGTPTADATLYVPWFACCDCARAIIIAGISRVVGHTQIMIRTPRRWMDEIAAADEMLDEAGVKREYYEGQLFDNFEMLFNREVWTP